MAGIRASWQLTPRACVFLEPQAPPAASPLGPALFGVRPADVAVNEDRISASRGFRKRSAWETFVGTPLRRFNASVEVTRRVGRRIRENGGFSACAGERFRLWDSGRCHDQNRQAPRKVLRPDVADDSAGLCFEFVILCRVGACLRLRLQRRPATIWCHGFKEQGKTQPSLVECSAVYSLTRIVPGSMKRIDCRNSLTCFKSSSLAAVVKRVSRHDPRRKITSCKWRLLGSS